MVATMMAMALAVVGLDSNTLSLSVYQTALSTTNVVPPTIPTETPDVVEAYERDRLETRGAQGSAAELQGKTATTDGPVRFTAPSVAFEANGQRLVAGGFQPVEAYDVLIANLDPTLQRQPSPETPEPLLERFEDGLTTQEVAALLADGNDAPDRVGAEAALIELAGAGKAVRQPLGDDAVWKRTS